MAIVTMTGNRDGFVFSIETSYPYEDLGNCETFEEYPMEFDEYGYKKIEAWEEYDTTVCEDARSAMGGCDISFYNLNFVRNEVVIESLNVTDMWFTDPVQELNFHKLKKEVDKKALADAWFFEV